MCYLLPLDDWSPVRTLIFFFGLYIYSRKIIFRLLENPNSPNGTRISISAPPPDNLDFRARRTSISMVPTNLGFRAVAMSAVRQQFCPVAKMTCLRHNLSFIHEGALFHKLHPKTV